MSLFPTKKVEYPFKSVP